jgi:hypothetical protein
MIKLILLFGIVGLGMAFSCKMEDNNKDLYTTLEKPVTEYYFRNIPQLEIIDTMYFLVDTVTPVRLAIMQIEEYADAVHEAKDRKSADSIKYQHKYDSAIYASDKITSEKFLFYRVHTMIQYTTTGKNKGNASTYLYFDKSFKVVPYDGIVERARVEKGLSDLDIDENPTPFIPGAFEGFKKMGFKVLFNVKKPQ